MAVPQRAEKESNRNSIGYGAAANNASYAKNEARVTNLAKAKNKQAANDQSYEPVRYKNADKSGFAQTRNAQVKMRTNSMPGSPTNQPLNPEHPDIATVQNQSYAKAGLQPTNLDAKPTPPPKDQTRAARAEYADRPAGLLVTPEARAVVMRRLQKKKGKKASPLARLRVTGVNFAILAWCGFIWFTFQIPFAIFNILLFGLTAAISSMTVPDPNNNILWYGLQLLGSAVVGGAKAVADAVNLITGIDISGINPGNFWLLTEVLLICYGLFILLVIFLQYKLALLNPLSGRATGLKFGALILALIGYSIPVLNLFPWFLVWTTVVWIYPK